MATELARKIAAEFERILDEGYTPEVDEFLRHVPKSVREEARGCIEAVVARRRPPKGPVKLSREEARAMFEEMARRAGV